MDYFNYIFENTFGDFSEEESLIINNFLNPENQNQFPDSEILEVMICYYIENDNFNDAKELLQKALKLYPHNEDIRFLEILITEEESVEKALELTEEHIAKYSGMEFLLIKTILLFQLNDFSEGEETFYKFVEKVDGEMEKNEMYYRMALFLCRENVFDYNADEENSMKRTLLIKKMVDYVVSHEYFDEGIIYFAEQFFLLGYTKEAKLIINSAIDNNSYNLEAWKTLSEINFAANAYIEAIDAFLYRIALNDSDKRLYFNCAICFQKAKDYSAAIEHFDYQIDKYPEELDDIQFFCDILAAQGDCFMSLQMYDEAKNKFEEVLKLNKNHFKALVLVAQCFYCQEDNEKALEYLEKALELDPDYDNFDYENLYVIAGQIFEDISENTKRKKEYLLSALMAYNKSLIYLNLARKMEKNYDEDLDSKIALTLCQIGRVYFLLGDDINALIKFQLAFYFDEETPLVNIFLVIIYMKFDLIKDGLVHYRLLSSEDVEQYEEIFPKLKSLRKFRETKER